MKTPLMTAVRVIATRFPFSPMATDVYSRFREPQQVLCPDKGEYATVQVDAEMAAPTVRWDCPGFELFAARSGLANVVEAAWSCSARFTAESATNGEITWQPD